MFEIGDYVVATPNWGTLPFKGFIERRHEDGRYALRLCQTGTSGTSHPPGRTLRVVTVVEEGILTYIGYKIGDVVRVTSRALRFRDDLEEGPSPYGVIVELRPELGGVLVKHDDGSGPYGWAFGEVEPAGRPSILRLLDEDDAASGVKEGDPRG